MPWIDAFWPGLTPFGPLLWQDTVYFTYSSSGSKGSIPRLCYKFNLNVVIDYKTQMEILEIITYIHPDILILSSFIWPHEFFSDQAPFLQQSTEYRV